jgi:hypothetical protein
MQSGRCIIKEIWWLGPILFAVMSESDHSMDVDHQSEIDQLTIQLEQNPYDYDAHVQRISLTRQIDIQSR